MSAHHHLVLRDRGEAHRHRWAPECDCGCNWKGQFRRRKAEAVEQYRGMVEGAETARRAWEQGHNGRRRGRLGKRGLIGLPRACTPASELPEALK